jgi:hypothetical protein
MRFRRQFCLLLPNVFFLASLSGAPQDTSPSAPDRSPDSDYPSNKVGVLIDDSDWDSIQFEAPAKLRLKNGFAPALTYGIAPATGVSEYTGAHSAVTVQPGRPTICVCHLISIPGDPVIVKLHPTNKNVRELDAGKIHIGGKFAKAESADLVAVDVSHPESTVWLVRPRMSLEAGEYALMLGTQNMAIYSFTMGAPAPEGKR